MNISKIVVYPEMNSFWVLVNFSFISLMKLSAMLTGTNLYFQKWSSYAVPFDFTLLRNYKD